MRELYFYQIFNLSNKQIMKSKSNIIRQGDVLLVRIAQLPEGSIHEKSKGDRIILALGENTGHHHSIAKTHGKLYTAPNQATILEVAEALTALEHQEHSPIPLAKGFYEVRLQTEYHPKELRRVAD